MENIIFYKLVVLFSALRLTMEIILKPGSLQQVLAKHENMYFDDRRALYRSADGNSCGPNFHGTFLF